MFGWYKLNGNKKKFVRIDSVLSKLGTYIICEGYTIYSDRISQGVRINELADFHLASKEEIEWCEREIKKWKSKNL